MAGRSRGVDGIDGPTYLLEQILGGKEGSDYTRRTLLDGTEVYDVGDGITFERSATGATSVVFRLATRQK